VNRQRKESSVKDFKETELQDVSGCRKENSVRDLKETGL
jgi:hypothetical protein